MTAYFYWGGKKLSWLRYLSVKSFAKFNPKWKIKVYYPSTPTIGNTWGTDEHIVEYTGEDWFSKLDEFAELIPLDIGSLGFSNELAEVHKSGVFRYWALSKFGGLYSDMDILYSKPFPKVKDRLIFKHPDGHYADGLLVTQKGDKLCKELLKSLKSADTSKYQSFGPTLWENLEVEGENMSKDLVYSCDWQNASQLFNRQKSLPDGAVGVHWFGGSIEAGRWENKLRPDSYAYPSTICDLMRKVEDV